MAKGKEVVRLSDRILGEGMYEKLKLRDRQLTAMLTNMEETFATAKVSIINNTATLYFMNGRVGKLEFGLAEKVLEEAERDFFDLDLDIKKLTRLRDNIREVMESIERSRQSEDKILKVEKFINKRNGSNSSGKNSPSLYVEDLTKVKDKARLLEHSATALLELKAGK